MEPEQEEKPPGHVTRRETAYAYAYAACLLLMSAAGSALIVWWAISFHRSNGQLWMVPLGLVLLGTPLVAWASVWASDSCCRPDILLAAQSGPVTTSHDPES